MESAGWREPTRKPQPEIRFPHLLRENLIFNITHGEYDGSQSIYQLHQII